MPLDRNIKKVLVLGSGPIVIGQAAEFDYAGTQACRALKEEGIEVVLVNSNPATIMTDKDIADHVYIEPLTAGYRQARSSRRNARTACLPTLGGQTGLNLAMELARGRLSGQIWRAPAGHQPGVHPTRRRTGRRFKDTHGGDRTSPCITVRRGGDAWRTRWPLPMRSGYPVIVRPAYTLGGTGGGIAYDERSAAGDRRPTACACQPCQPGARGADASPAGRKSSSR